jgi:hypothetical protein
MKSQIENIIVGLDIIKKYQPDAKITLNESQMYYEIRGLKSIISDEDKKKLSKHNWFLGSYRHYPDCIFHYETSFMMDYVRFQVE